MPQIPIIMPQLGESIAEAAIINFLVPPGSAVAAGQDLIEVETNKATMTVTSPCAGRVLVYAVQLQESYPVGAVLGQIEATAAEIEEAGLDLPVADPDDEAGAPAPVDTKSSGYRVQPTVRGLPVPANASGASYLSPRLKARMNELGLHAADLAGIAGSGAAGRVTIDDFEKFIASLEQHKMTKASSMRVAVADAMRRSWTRPIATVGLPVQLDILLAHRKASNPKPGPALYALRALAIALAESSAPAGRLVGSKVIHPSAIDVGFAVRYNELVELARERKLPADATGGSIATVTNYGTFGLVWATPIPLPEQTLVLGMGAGRRMPHWDEAKQQFVPVTEAYLTLSFDHRVLDGGGAGRLLARIGDLMGHPELL